MNKVKRASQFGRSMIEMLGVLAIIGVLSVGGISGYTEAMRKYKMTKTIEIFRASLFRLMEIDQMKRGGGWNEIHDVDLYVATGLLPEEICDKNYVNVYGDTGYSCQLPVGEIEMSFAWRHDIPLRGEYYIYFTDGDKERNCVDFLSYHWEKIVPKEWWDDGTGNVAWIAVYGNSYHDGDYIYNITQGVTELTMDNIAKACHNACKDKWCDIEMVFRTEN